MSGGLRIGIIDSGVEAAADLPIERGRRFLLTPEGSVEAAEGLDDKLGHGTEITRLIHAAAPEARLCHAQVFAAQFTTSPLLVAAGLACRRSRGLARRRGAGAGRTLLSRGLPRSPGGHGRCALRPWRGL